MAVLGVDFSFKPSMTYFLQVKLANKAGVLVAIPQIGNGSGDLTNLVDADAFLELPADKTEFKKGEFYPILRYRTF
jgi:molybdopterin molybdotransferase